MIRQLERSLLSSFRFHMLFEAEEVEGPEPAVVLEPAVEFAQGLRVEAVDPVAAIAGFANQVGLMKHAEMFGDSRAADVEAAGDFIDSQAVGVAKAVEDRPARRVGYGLVDGRFLRNHWVAFFAKRCPGSFVTGWLRV